MQQEKHAHQGNYLYQIERNPVAKEEERARGEVEVAKEGNEEEVDHYWDTGGRISYSHWQESINRP